MADLQEQIDGLMRQVSSNRDEIDALTDRADAADKRADAAEVRADAAEMRADASEKRADEFEAQSEIHRDMIAELQRDGVLSKQHAEQMEAALRSTRVVGAAIGILMSSRQLTEEAAFTVLRTASSKSNRKLRDLAAELVESANRSGSTN